MIKLISNKFTFLTVLICSTFLVVQFFCFYNSDVTLVKKWTDHKSNLIATKLFWQNNFKIYEKPTSQFNLEEDELDIIVSSHLPRPYPPGLWFILTPLTYSYYSNFLSFNQSSNLIILIISFFSILSISLLSSRDVQLDSKQKKFFFFTWILFSSVELLRWSLNGMYDGICILFLLLSVVTYFNKKFAFSIFLYSISMFFHFRAIWFLPLPVISFLYLLNEMKSKFIHSKDLIVILLSTLIFGISAYSLYLTLPQIKDLPINNEFYIHSFSFKNLNRILIYLISTFICCYYFIRSSSILSLSLIIWTSVLWFLTPLIQQWYILYLIPFVYVFLSEYSKKQEMINNSYWSILIWWIVTSSLIMRNSPFEFHFIKEFFSQF